MSLRRKNIESDLPQNDIDFELGFGSKFTGGLSYIVNQDGTYNIEKKGIDRSTVYEHMLKLPFPLFILELLGFFIGINAIFAFLYLLLGPGQLYGLSAGSFIDHFFDAFFFSIHTFTTIGYGNIYPTGLVAHILVILDSFTGLLLVAIATGILFVRFSRAKVKLKFSENMLIAPFKDGKSLQFRMVNSSKNILLNVDANITATWLETQKDGTAKRVFQRLPLEIDHVYMLPLNWTVVHPIDEKSPLHHTNKLEREKNMMEFLIMVRAYDAQYNQQIFKSYSYTCEKIVDGAKFKPMYYSTHEKTILDLRELGAYDKI